MLSQIEEPLPLAAAVARHRKEAVPAYAARDLAARMPGDGSAALGEYMVYRRRAPARTAGVKLRVGARPHRAQAAEIRRGPRLEPDGAHGEGAALRAVCEGDGTMAGEAKARCL